MIYDKGEWKGKPLTQYWVENSNYDYFNPITQVSGLCLNSTGRILLVKSPKGFWMLPGGTPKKGESIEETFEREVLEEASCKIFDLRLLGGIKVNFPQNPNENEGEEYYQLRYVARIFSVLEPSVEPDSGEILERKFVLPEEFFDYIGYSKNINHELLRLIKSF